MGKSPLDRIPAQVRNRICELALLEPNGIVRVSLAPGGAPLQMSRDAGKDCKNKADVPVPAYGLPMTCRALRKETLQRYFAVNTFMFYCNRSDKTGPRDKTGDWRDWSENLIRFRDAFGAPQLRQIRQAIFDIGEMQRAKDGRFVLRTLSKHEARVMRETVHPTAWISFRVRVHYTIGSSIKTIELYPVLGQKQQTLEEVQKKFDAADETIATCSAPQQYRDIARVGLDMLGVITKALALQLVDR